MVKPKTTQTADLSFSIIREETWAGAVMELNPPLCFFKENTHVQTKPTRPQST